MSKFYRILINTLKFLCLGFIVWFAVYFLWGDRFTIRFTDRGFASWFPQILVFLSAASIYGLFIFAIKSSRKKWQNILLFVGGFLFALIPFLAYHGYFQYQCNFWNYEIKSEKTLYINKLNKFETVKVLDSFCAINESEAKSDTVFSKQITPYFELNDEVRIKKAEKSDWKLK
ncbi:MAG: hypothetical protein WCY25_03415 [Moheibacter sp.]